jgi:YD repeat-containing protein
MLHHYRKILMFFTASALLVSLWAPSGRAQFLPRYNESRLERMDYQNSGGERGHTVFFYGRDGVLRSGVWLLEDSSRFSANYYLYNDAGLEIEKYREFSDSLTSTQRYEYDPEGHLVLERFDRSDGVSGTARFSYNPLGRLVAADCDMLRGWFSGRIEYQYSNDRLSGASISRNDELIGVIEYVYDSSGRLKTETWKFGEAWSQTFGYVYECIPSRVYSPSSPLLAFNSRYRVTGESYDYNQQIGGPSHYTYDTGGRLTKKVFERTDGLTTTTSFEFNEAGNLTSSHRQYSSGTTADFLFHYNNRLQLQEKTFKRSDGAAGFEQYSYDRRGRLVTARYSNMDFWLTGTLSFGYDEWGHLHSGRYEGDDGLNASLSIATDPHGNVLTILWTFPDSTTQTYNFTYTRIDCPPATKRGQ